jgi:hypothetical protein
MTCYGTALFTACYDSVRRRVNLISPLFEFYAASLKDGNVLCGVRGNVFGRSSEWKSGQIEILHWEHTNPVSKFDFERAELIDQQITTLKTRMERESESSNVDLHSLDLDERRE